jgi:glutathione synthetase
MSLVFDANVLCAERGLMIRLNSRDYTFEPFPITTRPSPFPKQAFYDITEVCPLFNHILFKISRDKEFLEQSLAKYVETINRFSPFRTAMYDDFTEKLLRVYQRTYDATKDQFVLQINRYDYMLHYDNITNKNTPQQVELNAFGCGGISTCLVNEVHLELSRKHECCQIPAEIVPRDQLNRVSNALVLAHTKYLTTRNTLEIKFVVLMVVHERLDRLVLDQKKIEMILKQHHGIECVRKNLTELARDKAENKLQVTEDGTLIVDGNCVSLVYFRAGYTPVDYKSDAEWDIRILLEEANCIKAPSVGIQLATTKRIQQVTCSKDVLRRYVDNDDLAHRAASVFTGIYDLSEEKYVSDALSNLENYVVKPERDGVGSVIVGEDMKKILEADVGSDSNGFYILMKKITPQPFRSSFVRKGDIISGECVSEVGTYGICLCNDKEIEFNEYAGYLVRTKLANVTDGGIISGNAALDSLFLI